MGSLNSHDMSSVNWDWILPASEFTQLCIVVDQSIPTPAARALAKRFSGVPQVSLLRIPEPAHLHREWSKYSEHQTSAVATVTGDAAKSMRPLSRAVKLLLWSSAPEELDWLGGIYGQPVLHTRYRIDTDEASAIQFGIERVFAVLREVVKCNVATGY
ncbi:hypothetical protein B0G81_1010 [Paraburkholderia sp. BL6665CI2N2]|uniref:hypothetical protein n=1 Tax=Paraburkholderia sp. BL6665CI2N2 TaxID=1938806 RepID=UPI00106617D1|nr:hypothetical protein [Paraburkholderia sp. BL6665CI2N2]TDY20837.1 hypothetical protein B0G81_1010 [Paraburkholderia sp. BL6665CI2N2]